MGDFCSLLLWRQEKDARTNSCDGSDVGGWATCSDCDTGPGVYLPGHSPLGLIQATRSRELSGRTRCGPFPDPPLATSGLLGPRGRRRACSLPSPRPAGRCPRSPTGGWGWERRQDGRQHLFPLQFVVFSPRPQGTSARPLPRPGSNRDCAKWQRWQPVYLAVTFHGSRSTPKPDLP